MIECPRAVMFGGIFLALVQARCCPVLGTGIAPMPQWDIPPPTSPLLALYYPLIY